VSPTAPQSGQNGAPGGSHGRDARVSLRWSIQAAIVAAAGSWDELGMRGRWHVFAARAACAVRRLRPDRNPLRRTLDRVEAALGAGLAVAILAGGPLAAMAAGHLASGIGSRAQPQQASWRQVPAVLLAHVPASGLDRKQVPARRAGPDGNRRAWHAPVPPSPVGSATVVVWVDVAGWPTRVSAQLGQAREQAGPLPMLVSLLAFIIVGVIVLCVGKVAYRALDRRRLADWEADWQAIEPQWSGRR
jgi:hypothetical protein